MSIFKKNENRLPTPDKVKRGKRFPVFFSFFLKMFIVCYLHD